MKHLLVRIATAVVIFLLLFLISLFLADIVSPDMVSPGSTGPDNLLAAELDEAMTLIEAAQAGAANTVWAIIPLLLLAGFSDSIGHAVILFANRVKPGRFAVTILFNTLLFIVSYLIWVVTVAFISLTVFERDTAFVRAALAVGVSYIPLVYSFLIALPYIGVLISNVIYLVTAFVLLGALQRYFPYTPAEAFVCAVLSFLAVIGFRLTIGRPIDWLEGKLLNAVAGTDLKDSVEDALAYVVSKGRQI